MRAIVANPQAPACLEIAEIDAPAADSTEALVRVSAFSLNRGEIRRAAAAPAGMQIGWDIAGVVEQAARDGSGPANGQRVVGFSRRMQGWAELVAIPTRDLAVIPDGVSDADASTLPVAGLTALYALERCERLLGSRVFITGSTGGVGYFACQLGKLMGAHVIAHVRRAEQEASVRATGADDVVISPDGSGLAEVGKVRAIIDGVGGPLLSALLPLLDESGRAVLYGVSAGAETALPVRDLMFTGDGRVEGFYLYRESEFETAAKGLDRLLTLLGDGRLKTMVSQTGSWAQISDTAQALIDRGFMGKAVLTID